MNNTLKISETFFRCFGITRTPCLRHGLVELKAPLEHIWLVQKKVNYETENDNLTILPFKIKWIKPNSISLEFFHSLDCLHISFFCLSTRISIQ